jgi:hypothetical protein
MHPHHPFDAPGAIDTRSPAAVAGAIDAMLGRRFRGWEGPLLHEAFDNVGRLYAGERHGYLRCDTPFHDLRHALESALAAARLVDGWEIGAAGARGSLGGDMALLAVVLALLHDVGFLRSDAERRVHGASFMAQHEARSIEFAERWLERTPLRPFAALARLIDATRVDSSIEALSGGETHRVVARIIATADVLAQLADRCYLEKCRDFLYAELVEAGMARGTGGRHANASYWSPEDLLGRTPQFIDRRVTSRLDTGLGGVHRLMRTHFGGDDPYAAAVAGNLAHLRAVLADARFDLLRRRPTAVFAED